MELIDVMYRGTGGAGHGGLLVGGANQSIMNDPYIA